MIPFNKTSITEIEQEYMQDAMKNGKTCGDGVYTKKCMNWFKEKCNIDNFLLTTSCTHALEMSAVLAEIKDEDEVIMPSYTFSSTANCVLARNAKPIFVDIDKNTFNIDVNLIEEKITDRTKAILPIHYAGISADMDKIVEIAKKHNLIVIEDSAQGVLAYYKEKLLGTIGDYGCYSFHETKNYVMGEGGALIVKEKSKYNEAEIIRDAGTNKGQFSRGETGKYMWQGYGSSYLPSDILSGLLYGQLMRAGEIMEKRMRVWSYYNERLANLEQSGKLTRMHVPEYAKHNAHMYYIVLENEETRLKLIEYLKANGIIATFHYIPLHTAPMGESLGYKEGELPITEEYAYRIMRLPLYADMEEKDMEYVCKKIEEFFGN